MGVGDSGRDELTRRRFLGLAAAGVSLAAFGGYGSGIGAARAVEAAGDFPTFAFAGETFNRDELDYDPTGELIFPSVIKASDYFEDPLGEYYLYYAPHDPPGGICLAYAESLDGPWTEYEGNPIISNTWEPYYSVSHVSSPHAIWIEAEGKLFLYFHGENYETRYATSGDGFSFEYGGVAVSTADENLSESDQASYARVFEYTIPSLQNRYMMLFMGDKPDGEGLGGKNRDIRLAISEDARKWSVVPNPLISPTGDEGSDISSPHFFPWKGRNHVVYHASSGNMHITDVGENFDQENHLGVFHDSMSSTPDSGRSAAPSFYTAGDTMYMFYEAGGRLDATIAYAKADVSSLDLPALRLECGATPDELWPPNSRMVAVSTTLGITNGVLGPYGFSLEAVESDESRARGQSNLESDVQGFEEGTSDTEGRLRARRDSRGDGRTYRLIYTARDSFGYEGTCEAVVRVPHDRS